VAAAAAELARACERRRRDPARIERSLRIFVRPDPAAGPAALAAEYRRLHPWFRDLPGERLAEAIVSGPASACRRRLAELAEALGLDLALADLSGLPYNAARHALEALAPRGEAR